MICTIYLNNYLFFGETEVCNIISYNVLPQNLVPAKVFP